MTAYTYKKPWGPYKGLNIDIEIQNFHYLQKVTDLAIIFDNSTDMNELYRGWRRIDYAYEIMYRFINTLPSLPLKNSVLIYGDREEIPDQFQDNLKSTSSFWSNTTLQHKHITLNLALSDYLKDENKYKKTDAVVIISHCQNIDNETIALARKLHMLNGNKTCIYMIGAGDVAACYKLIPYGQCGFAVSADNIASQINMANFIKKLLLKEPKDLDNDGIFDHEDQCLNTPLSQTIDHTGCKRKNNYPFKIQEQ